MIHTERLVLRPIVPDDAEPLFSLFNNWAVIQWLSQPPWPYTLADARAYASGQSVRAQSREEAFAITRDDALIGSVTVRLRPASDLQRTAGPNIGFWLGEPYWGRGYMTEAAAGLTRAVFATGDNHVIYAGAFAGNHASLRVQEKLGFAQAGGTMLMSRPQSRELPHVNLALTRAAFASAAAA